MTMDTSKYSKFPSVVAVLDCVQNRYNAGIQSGTVALCEYITFLVSVTPPWLHTQLSVTGSIVS